MNATKRFIWKDRDAAAIDLLQLAYHAPLDISQLALQLQSAIRSNAATSELAAVALDPQRSDWEHRLAIRAVARAPGDTHLPDFSRLMSHDLSTRLRKRKEYDHLPQHRQISALENTVDFLEEICGLMENHPSNAGWFFETLDAVDEPVLHRHLLLALINDRLPQNLLNQVDRRLSSLFTEHPELFTLDMVVHRLRTNHHRSRLQCLGERLDEIVELCLDIEEADLNSLYFLLNDWQELKNAVYEKRPEVEEFMRSEKRRRAEKHARRRQVSQNYKQTAVYIKLEALYLRALNGDREAFKALSDHASRWNEHIITRALSTHFIGRLHPQCDVVDTLSCLLRYTDDDWGTPPYYSPVRTEAGEALYRIASPQAWEALVNGFFINPRNILAGFMLLWIEQLTDRLSGINHESRRPELAAGDLSGCPWVGVLKKLDIT